VTVASASSVTCKTSPGAGTRNALRLSLAGRDAQLATDKQYYIDYDAPQVYTVRTAPNQAPGTDGMYLLTVHGVNFGIPGVSAASVLVGRQVCTDAKVATADTITCTAPAGSGANLDVTVAVDGQWSKAQADARFSYAAPVVSGITVSGGLQQGISTEGGARLTIFGANFAPAPSAVSVSVGPALCENVTVVSSSQLQCSAPKGAGKSLYVQVVVEGQASAAAPSMLSYAPPAFTELLLVPHIPETVDGSVLLVVQGSNFGPLGWPLAPVLLLGNKSCDTTLISPIYLRASIPGGSGARLPLQLLLGGAFSAPPGPNSRAIGGSGAQQLACDARQGGDCSFYFSYLPPVIERVSPSGQSLDHPAVRITITGKRFGAAAEAITVRIGDMPCTELILRTPYTEVTCLPPEIADTKRYRISVNVKGMSSDASSAPSFDFYLPSLNESQIWGCKAGAIVLIVLLVVLLSLVIWNREVDVIKAAAPVFVVISVLGGIVMVLTIFVLNPTNVYENSSAFAPVWPLVLGFSLFFGSVTLKNYRILKYDSRSFFISSYICLRTAKHVCFVFATVSMIFLFAALCSSIVLIAPNRMVHSRFVTNTSFAEFLGPRTSKPLLSLTTNFYSASASSLLLILFFSAYWRP
jgi:hypothetical protein